MDKLITAYKETLNRGMALGIFIFLVGFYLLPHPSAVKLGFYLLILAPWLFASPYIYRKKAIFAEPMVISSLALTFYLATSSFWGQNQGLSAGLYFYKQVVFILAWLTACMWVGSIYPKFFQLLPRLIVWIGSLAIAWTIGRYFYTESLGFPRMQGLGANKNSLIAATSFGVIGVMALTLGRQRYPESTFNRYFWLTLLAGAALALTQSRGPMGYLAITLALALYIYPPKGRQLLYKIALVSAIAGLIVALYPETINHIRGRGVSWSHRDEIWIYMFQRFLETPLWGEGVALKTNVVLPSGFQAEHSHNSWLATLRYGGLIGFALSLWHLKTCFQGWGQHPQMTALYLWLVFGCLSAFTTGSLFLAKPDWMWLFYWMPIGLICGFRAALTDTLNTDCATIEQKQTGAS